MIGENKILKEQILNANKDYVASLNRVSIKRASLKEPFLATSFRLGINILNEDYLCENIKIDDKRDIFKYSNVKLFGNSDNIEYIEEPVVILDMVPHYSHFIIDVISKFLYIKKYFIDAVPFFITNESEEQQKDFISHTHTFNDILQKIDFMYPIRKKIDISKNNKTFIFKTIYSIAPIAEYGDHQRLYEITDLYPDIRKIFIPDRPSYNNRNIFIPRSNMFENRSGNINKLKILLEKNNYEILFFENLSFEEQINAFYDAKNIIALSGCSLVNLLFTNDEAKILSFYSNPGYCTFEWPFIAQKFNLQYNDIYLQHNKTHKIFDIFKLLYDNE